MSLDRAPVFREARRWPALLDPFLGSAAGGGGGVGGALVAATGVMPDAVETLDLVCSSTQERLNPVFVQ